MYSNVIIFFRKLSLNLAYDALLLVFRIYQSRSIGQVGTSVHFLLQQGRSHSVINEKHDLANKTEKNV